MMKTKLLFQRFFASLLLLAVSALSWAYDFEENGIYYNRLEGTNVEVTYKNGVPYSGDVTIPATVTHEATIYNVTAIGESAFSGCTGLTTVTIPGSVTSIGNAAFWACHSLTTVNIPGSVTSIGYGAFASCIELESVNISEGVASIGMSAFNSCAKLTTINIPESVTSIGVGAFLNCSSLPAIDYVRYADTYLVGATDKNQSFYAIKWGTRFIGSEAFSDCTNLTDIVIPNSVTYIDQEAFYNCTKLDRVCNLSATPQELGSDNPFSGSGTPTLYVPIGSLATYTGNASWLAIFGENIKELQHVDVTIPAGGTRTFCNFVDLDFSGVSGLKAYIISGFSPSTGTLTLTRVTNVPAGTGLLLRGEEGNYEVPVLATDMYYSNMLKGVNEAIMLSPTEGDYTNFILADGTHGVGFYPVSETAEFAAGKAYLQMPTAKVPTLGGGEARAFILDFENEEATGIGFTKATAAPQEDGVYYDLTGRRVEKPSKGFYIMNGKKMFIQ